MTDNEMLLAMSSIMDKKLEPLKKDIESIKKEQTRINIIIENDIRRDIQVLAENYLPSAKRYESELNKIIELESDVSLLKKVVAEHSEKLQKIS